MDRNIFINNHAIPNPESVEAAYHVSLDTANANTQELINEISASYSTEGQPGNTGKQLQVLKDLGIDADPAVMDIRGMFKDSTGKPWIEMLMTRNAATRLKSFPWVKGVSIMAEKGTENADNIYPGMPGLNWTKDNYGPVYIPRIGDHIKMNIFNYYLYQKAIRDYENNPTLTLKDSQVYINGKPVTDYVMKMNYYFMMGDNRDNSMDSRYWGLVPENYIIGKAFMILFSTDPHANIRWNRTLTFIR